MTQRQLPAERTQKEQIPKPSGKNPVEAEDREANQPTGSTLASEALPNHYYRNVARLTARVANALEYAHRAGVLHRDIKPSNLILDQAGTIWVTDFGLARREELESQTQTGEVLGTLRYMSPEQLQGKGDQRTDIYSLGLTLFELLTLRPALDATKQRLRDPDKYSMVEFSNQEKRFIPRDLQTIVLKATAYVPENRYLRARDFEEDIERFLDDRPILARQQTIAEACVRWSRRNPVIATMAATVFGLLLTIAGLLGLWNRQQRATLGQLKSAYSTAAESLVQRTTALERVELESRRAEHNLELAMEAFHTIVDNISARGRSLDWSSLEGEDIENLGLSDTVLTQADADLLRSLQSFFERFAEENGTDLRLDTALARRRVGEIEAKIGRAHV